MFFSAWFNSAWDGTMRTRAFVAKETERPLECFLALWEDSVALHFVAPATLAEDAELSMAWWLVLHVVMLEAISL